MVHWLGSLDCSRGLGDQSRKAGAGSYRHSQLLHRFSGFLYPSCQILLRTQGFALDYVCALDPSQLAHKRVKVLTTATPGRSHKGQIQAYCTGGGYLGEESAVPEPGHQWKQYLERSLHWMGNLGSGVRALPALFCRHLSKITQQVHG